MRRLDLALVAIFVAACTSSPVQPASPTPTAVAQPSASPAANPIAHPTAAPTADPTPTPTPSPTATPDLAPTPSPTASPTAPPPTDPPSPSPVASPIGAPAAEPGKVRLMAIGDVMLGQSIGRRIVRRGPLAPWARVVQYFNQADLVAANLECTISERGTAWRKTFTFRAPLAAADSLVAGGIDIVSLANNHALDYGITAFEDTLGLLEDRGIGYAGGGRDQAAAHAPLIVEENGLRIAFLGYVLPFSGRPAFNTRQWAAGASRPGLAIGSPEIVAREVSAVRGSVDVVVVMVHGGTEYSRGPIRKVRDFAAAAVDAGAALVIGHHPHVLHGYRRGAGTLIAYSIGNFVFDYFKGRPNDTAILDVTLSANGVESLGWIPIVIERGFPRPAAGAEIPRIRRALAEY